MGAFGLCRDLSTILVLGGARSGKSRYALALVEAVRSEHIFIATAEALDDEMSHRIERHKRDRGSSWETVEAPLQLPEAISQAGASDKAVLVDCLTLWLSNVMGANLDVVRETDRLVESIESATVPLVLVSNEVGMGIVPESPLGRDFRDEQGRLNQRIAACCDRVDFVAAGLPITLKP
jgi:adenosylcobinamide kinase/adenosylcobinamide-phosphate guanylyltransferase